MRHCIEKDTCDTARMCLKERFFRVTGVFVIIHTEPADSFLELEAKEPFDWWNLDLCWCNRDIKEIVVKNISLILKDICDGKCLFGLLWQQQEE